MTTHADSLPTVMRADGVPGPAQGCWTYEDYAALPDDGARYEVIDGILYLMRGPSPRHQSASVRFSSYLLIHVEFAGLGRVFAAPLDVLLPRAQPVQPDIIVLFNHKLHFITERGIEGPPALVVEIASPGTRTHDRSKKLTVYADAGVPEYWLAEPADRTVELLVLEDGAYRSLGVFTREAPLPSGVLPGMPVRVGKVFA